MTTNKTKAAKIRKMLTKGASTREIRDKLNVATSYIYLIKSQMRKAEAAAVVDFVPASPPPDPSAKPVPTTSKRRGRPPKLKVIPPERIIVAPRIKMNAPLFPPQLAVEATEEAVKKPTLWQRFVRWCRA